MSSPSLVDDALAIAATGVPVFPCSSEKNPVCAGGFKAATTDPGRIRSLFSHSAAALIGMPTGAVSGIVALDVDSRNGGDDWLDANRADIPQTRTHSTMSGGTHFLFRDGGLGLRNSAGLIKNGRKQGIAPGIDFRADGGYIVIPPSSGYSVTNPAAIANLPDWIIPLCRKAPEDVAPVRSPHVRPWKRDKPPQSNEATPYGAAALISGCNEILGAPDGSKADTINRVAYSIGGLVTAGEIPGPEAWSALSDAVGGILHLCRDKRKAEKMLERSFSEGKARPRSVPGRAPMADGIDPVIAPFLQQIAIKVAKDNRGKTIAIPAGIYAVDGLLKAMLDDCLERAPRPQPLLALGAAISVIATAGGRRYVTTTGLCPNLYIVSVAPSGAGKDAPLDYVRRIFSAAEMVPWLGGETIASGAGLATALAGHPVRIFCLDELGLMLQSITGKKAAPYQAEIMQNLMKLYSRANSNFLGKQYANEAERPRIDIQNPHAAIFGATTPQTLWAALEGGALIDGSVARFNFFLTDQGAVPRNKALVLGALPSGIIEGVKAISRGAEGHDYGGNLTQAMLSSVPVAPYAVPYSPDAHVAMEAYLDKQEQWQSRINSIGAAPKPGEGEIVARIGEHCAKFAMVGAISRNPGVPLIEKQDVVWAALLTDFCAETLLNHSSANVADSDFEKKLNKTFEIIRKRGPITQSAMFQAGFKYPPREAQQILDALITGGMIDTERSDPGARGGRPALKYYAKARLAGCAPPEAED